MIFFLVMPGLFGGVGNYFVPIFQGSPEVVYPRVNNFSILILSLSYLFVMFSLISAFGGGTGWTLYYYFLLMCILFILCCILQNLFFYNLILGNGGHNFLPWNSSSEHDVATFCLKSIVVLFFNLRQCT